MSSIPSSYGANIAFIEELYEKYQSDPNSVSPSWREFFRGYQPEEEEASGAPASSPVPAPPPPRAAAPHIAAVPTTAPNATSPASTAIGTIPTRLPMAGERVRQLGQKPETGVKTLPQFRHRIGRRSRAMACLAAFSVRDRF